MSCSPDKGLLTNTNTIGGLLLPLTPKHVFVSPSILFGLPIYSLSFSVPTVVRQWTLRVKDAQVTLLALEDKGN